MAVKRKQWLVYMFDVRLKNRFMGKCKMINKDWKLVLENLIRGWLFDNPEEGSK